MLVEQRPWLAQATSSHDESLLCLAKKLDSLDFPEDQLAGKVSVVGPGLSFPERLLLCTPKSRYRKLRSKIDSVTLCDSSGSFSACVGRANFWLDHPLTEIRADRSFQPDSGMVNYHLGNVRSFLTKFPQARFDVMTFFCIPNIEEELRENSGFFISEHLQKSGCLLGSGLFSAKVIHLPPNFKIETMVELKSPENSIPGANTSHNLGFVARTT